MEFPSTDNTIVGHREVHATACPDALDIDRIVREAQGEAMTAQETYDLIASLLQEKIVAPQNDTNVAIKAAIETAAHHKHETSEPK